MGHIFFEWNKCLCMYCIKQHRNIKRRRYNIKSIIIVFISFRTLQIPCAVRNILEWIVHCNVIAKMDIATLPQEYARKTSVTNWTRMIIKICSAPNYWHLIFKALFFYFLNQFRQDQKWLYPFQWHKSRKCDFRWIFLSNSSEGAPCFIHKIYAPSSFLLQGKHLPFYPSPLRLNIFRLFVTLSLTQLYRYTPEIFLFTTATFKYTYRCPLRRIV
jgi:hypothetical protein